VVWALGGPGLADLLADDAPAYAAAIAWVGLAPVPLALALVAATRTPWPWVVLVGVHLVVLTAAVVRLRHLAPGSAWVAVALSVVLGLVSAVAVTAWKAGPSRCPGEPMAQRSRRRSGAA
jgi:hypothetical protein